MTVLAGVLLIVVGMYIILHEDKKWQKVESWESNISYDF